MSFKEFIEQQLTEAKRPIFISDDGRLKYSITKSVEWDEWMAKAYVDGKYNEAKTIYTNDKEEILMNAESAIKRWNGLTDEAKEKEIKSSIKFSKKLERE